MNSKIYLAFVILILATLLSACAGAAFARSSSPAFQAEPDEPVTRTITVSGSGRAFMTPDIAYINIGVHTEDKNASEAVAANNSQSQGVIDALLNLGVDEKDIQTNNFSIYPQQEYDSEGKPTGEINYVVDNSVHVTVRDLEQIGELLDAAVKAGANSINGIQFDVDDKSEAQSEARQAAVDSAIAKAEELAEASGVTLGEVITIQETSGAVPVPMYDLRTAEQPMMAEAASVPVSPGQMTITVVVNIVYGIR